MANKKYNEATIVALLQKKQDLIFNQNKLIQHVTGNKAKCDVGINSKGKIDFLVNFCGYIHIYVSGQ